MKAACLSFHFALSS